jgi:IS605 OrfB family transposase
MREQFGLSSQMTVRAIAKAIDTYKRDKSKSCTFNPKGAVVYDERLMSFKKDHHVSLLTLSGRQLIPLIFGKYQSDLLPYMKGQADLILRDGVFYLFATVDLPNVTPIETTGILGIDLGIVEIATDSEGHSYSGEKVKTVRRKTRRIRALLQSKGTKSAKKHLKRINRKQSRFVRDTNHCISKQLVTTASSSTKAIALEDLAGIRERADGYGREMRWLMGNWAFYQLRQFITYKAYAVGIPVVLVNPRNTSRECHECGYIDKANRKSQAHFHCIQCGHDTNADKNAALNIMARAAVNLPIVAAVRG